MTREELKALVDKISYEGGLPEYLFNYAGVSGFNGTTNEILDAAHDAYKAFFRLSGLFADYCREMGVDPYEV